MVLVRILSWVLIFSTNLLIRGRSEKAEHISTVRLIRRGGYSVFDPVEQLTQNRFVRLGCMKSSNESVCYGKIRNDTCEVDRELFAEEPIEFGLKFQPTLVTTTGCSSNFSTYEQFRCNSSSTSSNIRPVITCLYNGTNRQFNDDVCYLNGTAPRTSCVRNGTRNREIEHEKNPVTFNCDNGEYRCQMFWKLSRYYSLCDSAVISCKMRKVNGVRFPSCVGLLNKDGVTHMCDDMKEGNLQNHNASCNTAKGADWNIKDWLSFYNVGPLIDLPSVLALSYGSGEQVKQVKTYKSEERSFTTVNYLWIGALLAKIVMVSALFIACEVLSRRYGVFVVANDEPRIFSFFNTTVHRIRRGRSARNDENWNLCVKLENGVVKLHDANKESVTG